VSITIVLLGRTLKLSLAKTPEPKDSTEERPAHVAAIGTHHQVEAKPDLYMGFRN
jgi:hypothetical protein